MLVREAMTGPAVVLGPTHTLREAARRMKARGAFSAVVTDHESDQPGVVTDTNIISAIAAGADVDTAHVGEHLDGSFVVVAAPNWSLEQAASKMVTTGVRRIVVCENGEITGMLTVRDVVTHWSPADLANLI